MKHLFKSLITLATIALFAGCAREIGDPRGVASGDQIPVSFTVSTSGSVATKAFSDGNTANALLVGVYNKQGEGETATYTYLDGLSVTTLGDIYFENRATKFETTLVRGQNYVLVFWAQKPGVSPYTIDFASKKLTVSTTGNANDEGRDAFYKVFETGAISESNYNFVGIELTRPFAQINVLAPNEDVVNAAKSGVTFSTSEVKIDKAPDTMDLLTGAVSGEKTYTYSAAAISEPPFDDYASTHTYIAMNYVLAGEKKALYDVHLDVVSKVGGVDQSPIHFDVSSAPAQRNYRTNIIGNVFTIDASFNIIINPIYNTPDYSEGLGLTFEPTTITPTVPTTLPEGVSITPAGGTTPSVINFGVAALNASTPVTIPVTPSVNTTVKARSSNVAVATAEVVDGPGVKVTPVGPGEAVITIYTDAILATKSADVDSTKNYAGAKYEYKVVVEKPIEKKGVKIVSQDINLKLNESATLEYEVVPEDAKVVITPAEGADEYFTWDAAAKKVTAKKVTPAGGVGIELTVAETDTTKAASETVYVIISEKEVPTVVFEAFTLKVDETKEIAYLVEPEDLAVTFEAEKDQEVLEVVKVEGKDAVKGLKGGSAKLTLKIAETTTTAAFSKTVAINVDKLKATVTADALSLTAGDTKTLVADEDFLTDSDGAVSLSVAAEYTDYLTVEPGTLKVKALKEGAAKLSINVAESDKYLAATEEVDVTIAAAPVATPTEATITIEGVPTAAVEPGESFDVTITTNSTAALVVSATTGASVAPKSGNVYTVTAADDLTADTEVTLTASVAAVENAFTAAEKTAKFTVKKKEVVVPPTSSEYVKVTSTADVTDGVYLIVYEEGAVAFNGALETLDAANNGIEVTIADGKITGNETIDASAFTLDVIEGGFSVKNASGSYIGQTTDANGLKSQTTAIVNTISVTAEGDADIVSGAAYLRYNSAKDNLRFRYFKSSTYAQQKAVALYKKVGSGSGTVPTQKKDATVTINGTIPTEAMAKDATFEFTAETTSDATAFDVKLSPEGAATFAAKSGAANTWIVTAGEPAAETTVTLTVSVAATNEYKAASATKTFKVAKKAGDEPSPDYDFSHNVDYEAGENSVMQKATLNGAVDETDVLKLSTSSKGGNGIIYVPAGSTTLSFYAIGWKDASATLTFTQGGEEIGTVSPIANEGLTGNVQPYVITVTNDDLYTITLNSDAPITVTAKARAAIFAAKGNGSGEPNHPSSGVTYKKVTSIQSGKSYAIIGVKDGTYYAATPIAADKTYGYPAGKTCTLSGDIITTDLGNYVFTFTSIEGGYSIAQPDGRFLATAGTYKSAQISDSAVVWTVEPQADGSFKIICSVNDYFIQHGNGTYTTFGVSDDANYGTLPYLYELSN